MSATRPVNASIDERIAQYKQNEIKVGDTFPEVTLTRYEGDARVNFSTQDQLRGRNVVIFTVPGAWTPTCTGKHLAGYKEHAQALYATGLVSRIICIAPDKVDVARAWSRIEGNPEQIDIWADDELQLTDKLGLMMNMSGNRAQREGIQRTSMFVEDCIVTFFGKEESAANCVISHASRMLEYLTNLSAQKIDHADTI